MFKVYDSMDWGYVYTHEIIPRVKTMNRSVSPKVSLVIHSPSSLHPHPQRDFSVIIDECASHRILYKQTHSMYSLSFLFQHEKSSKLLS